MNISDDGKVFAVGLPFVEEHERPLLNQFQDSAIEGHTKFGIRSGSNDQHSAVMIPTRDDSRIKSSYMAHKEGPESQLITFK